MTVIAPADAAEVRAAMHAMMEHHGPTYLRLTRDATKPVTPAGRGFEIGKAYLLREGTDVTLIGTGAQTARLLKRRHCLPAQASRPMCCICPRSSRSIGRRLSPQAAHTGLVVTAEEHSVIGGLGGAVAETLAEERPTLMRRIGLRDVFAESAPNAPLLDLD